MTSTEQKKSDYVSVRYDERRVPKTGYPFLLASYLFDRFGLKKGDKILEIGCGRGEVLAAFQKLGLDCRGLDLSDYSVDSLKEFNVKKNDVSREPLPFEAETFDVVYHKSLIEHLPSPENLMKETLRVLRAGGRVIVLTPDWGSQMRVFYEDFTHCKPYTVIALNDLLKVYGFSKVQAELFYQLPVLWRHPRLKTFSRLLRMFLSTPAARKLSELSRISFFRWSVELMVLGTGVKE